MEVVRRLGLQAEFAKQGRKKYMDAVFCFADNVRVKQQARYSVPISSANDLDYTIFRKRLTLAQRRRGRRARSAS